MHLLPDRIGGKAKGSNLSSGQWSRCATLLSCTELERGGLGGSAPRQGGVIWYRVEVRFHTATSVPDTRNAELHQGHLGPGPSKTARKGAGRGTEGLPGSSVRSRPAPPDPSKKLRINHDSIDKIRRRLRETPEFARVIVNNRPYRDFDGIKKAFERHERESRNSRNSKNWTSD